MNETQWQQVAALHKGIARVTGKPWACTCIGCEDGRKARPRMDNDEKKTIDGILGRFDEYEEQKATETRLAVGLLHRAQAERDEKSWGCECEGCTELRQSLSVAASFGRLGGLAGKGKAKTRSKKHYSRAGKVGGKIGGKATGPSKRRDTWKANFAKKKTQG